MNNDKLIKNGAGEIDIIAIIVNAGMRPTKQRVILAKHLFTGCDRHVTADILYLQANEEKVKVSLATVYNTLHQFTEAGLLKKIIINSSKIWFDTNTSNHYHFYIEPEDEIRDIVSDDTIIANLPQPPIGTDITKIDVVIHVA